MIAFVVSAALAGAAGALFGNGFSQLSATKFDFNTSILILVFVVLGGLGNMRGSIVAATVLTILPEALRQFSDYRMLVYAIVLILVMIVRNNPTDQGFVARVMPSARPMTKRKGGERRCLSSSSNAARWCRFPAIPSSPSATSTPHPCSRPCTWG